MDRKQINSKDMLLCFLYSPGQGNSFNEPIVGRTKLTKMMFLFEKEIYNKFFEDYIEIVLPEFNPYLFGPFSKQLFDDLAFFESIKMIKTNETLIPISDACKVECEEAFADEIDVDDDWKEASFECSSKYELEYSLTVVGRRYVDEKLWKLFSALQKEKLKNFKAQINKISLNTLLNYVYNKYPETTKESIIVDKYLHKSGEEN